MKKSFLAVILFLSSISGVCKAELKSAIGFGVQYGGTIGWQGSVMKDRHRGNFGIGFFGASVGYDYKLTGKLSVGTSPFVIYPVLVSTRGLLKAGNSLRINYYPKGTFMIGWVFGVDILRVSDVGLGTSRAGTEYFFTIGYGL